MALDDAFAGAVSMAVSDLVAADVRTARKAELDKELVGRARLWIAKFSVTKDETVEDRRQLTVSVRVDRDKLRARLAELGIATKDATSQQGGGSAEPPATTARTATALVALSSAAGSRADWGASADSKLPGLSALANLMRTNGFAVRKAPSTGPAPAADGDYPLSDDDADALAAEAKADTVLVASIKVGDSVPVRGQATTAALVTARVRMIERKDKNVVGQGIATAGARGEDPSYAVDRALVGAATDVLPPGLGKLDAAHSFAGDDTPLAEPGVVLLRLPSRTPYSMVLEEQKYLAGAKGVRGATLRRLSPAGWVIGIATGEPIEQVARIAKKAPTSDTSATVKIVGDIVELTLAGAP